MMKSLKGKTLYDIKIYILKKCQSHISKFFYHSYGEESVIESPLIIRNKKKIQIGNNVTIRRAARIEVVTKYNNILYEPLLQIGDNTIIEYNFHISCASKIVIENDVLIAGNVTIVDNNHGFENIEKSILKNNLSKPRNVIIGQESFIGMGARIMPGVKIGKHCVIGTNGVVTKDVPDYSVVAGVPSKIIKRYNFITKEWERTNANGEFYLNK